jgi:hypothetical protein
VVYKRAGKENDNDKERKFFAYFKESVMKGPQKGFRERSFRSLFRQIILNIQLKHQRLIPDESFFVSPCYL